MMEPGKQHPRRARSVQHAENRMSVPSRILQLALEVDCIAMQVEIAAQAGRNTILSSFSGAL
jgi:hypothetical protein